MQNRIEGLEAGSVFSSTPIEVVAAADQMFMEAPGMQLHDGVAGARMQRPEPRWVDAIDPEFFVRPPLARAG